MSEQTEQAIHEQAHEFFTIVDLALLIDKYGVDYVLTKVLLCVNSPEHAVLLHMLLKHIPAAQAKMYNAPLEEKLI